MSAIKAGNSVWRSNAAHELGYLNPAIHRQIYTAGMNLPRTFGFNDPYVGNWFFRAPVFTKNGVAQIPPATPTSLPSPTPKPAYIAPGLTVEQVAVPKQVVPVVPTTSIAPVQPSVMPVRQGFNPEMLQQMRSNPQFMSWLYNTFFGRALPAGNQPQALPASSTKYMLPMPSGRDANGSIITPIPEGAQFSLFKKGGKVKKVRKCQTGIEMEEYDPLAEEEYYNDGELIGDTGGNVTKFPGGSFGQNSFTQGSDQKTPYN